MWVWKLMNEFFTFFLTWNICVETDSTLSQIKKKKQIKKIEKNQIQTMKIHFPTLPNLQNSQTPKLLLCCNRKRYIHSKAAKIDMMGHGCWQLRKFWNLGGGKCVSRIFQGLRRCLWFFCSIELFKVWSVWNVFARKLQSEMWVLKFGLKCVCWNCTWNVCWNWPEMHVMKLCLKCVLKLTWHKSEVHVREKNQYHTAQ